MIAPDMATMLAFIVTDANIHPSVLQALLGLHVRTTFNSVTVDGDTAVMLVVLLTVTLEAATEPNFTVAPVRKPVPVIVTEVPPVVGPDVGDNEVTVGKIGRAHV